MMEMFEMAEADMAPRQSGQNRPRLQAFPPHFFAGGDDGQRPAGGNVQRRHRFAAEIFANGGAHNCPPIAEARIRCLARTLELHVPQFAFAVAQLGNHQGPAIAQLSRPDPELMPGINHGKGLRARKRTASGKNLQKGGIMKDLWVKADQRRGFRIGMNQAGRRSHFLRRHGGVEIARQPGEMIFRRKAENRHGLTLARFSDATQFSNSFRNRDRSCLEKPAWRVSPPVTSRKWRLSSRIPSAMPMLWVLKGLPLGESTRAPLSRQRAASGMSAVMAMSSGLIWPAIQSSA